MFGRNSGSCRHNFNEYSRLSLTRPKVKSKAPISEMRNSPAGSGQVKLLNCSRNFSVMHIVPALFRSEDGVIGGAERYAFELARYMADVVSTTLVSFGENPEEQAIGRLRVRVLGNTHFVRGQRANPISLSLLSSIRNADIVHCHQQHVLASSIAATVCRMTKRKVFVTDLGGGGWDVSAYLSTDNWYNGHLHISEYSRTISRRSADLRSHVILGGVDTEKFSPDPRHSPREGVLFVGRLLPHKGVNYLVQGLPQGISLSIIGKPYDAGFYRDLQILAQGKNIAFHDNFDDAALIRAYRTAICVVLPS